jgi:hypothetical protein
MAQRAADRHGETVRVLIEERLGPGRYQGRAAHQAPEVDGVTTVRSAAALAADDIVTAVVAGSEGVDLVAEVRAGAPAPAPAEAPAPARAVAPAGGRAARW